MVVNSVNACDFVVAQQKTPCGARAPQGFEATSGRWNFQVRICDDHVNDLAEGLRAMGVQVTCKTADRKKREAYVARSGALFSMADARLWLTENGFEVQPAGRLSRGNMELYAEAH